MWIWTLKSESEHALFCDESTCTYRKLFRKIGPFSFSQDWKLHSIEAFLKDTYILTRIRTFIFFATHFLWVFKFKIFNYLLSGVLLTECSFGIQIFRITQGKRSITWIIMMEFLEMFWLLLEVFLEIIRESSDLEKLPPEPSSPCSRAVAELDNSVRWRKRGPTLASEFPVIIPAVRSCGHCTHCRRKSLCM